MINLPSGGAKSENSSAASGSSKQLTPIPRDAHQSDDKSGGGSSLTASGDHSGSSAPFMPPPPPPPPPVHSASVELVARAGGESSGASHHFDDDTGIAERGTRFAGESASASAADPIAGRSTSASQRSASAASAASRLDGFDPDDADTRAKYVKRYPFYMGVVRWLKCALAVDYSLPFLASLHFTSHCCYGFSSCYG